jgi:MerR family transcriptional regulator, light-induced transcriptional regulator
MEIQNSPRLSAATVPYPLLPQRGNAHMLRGERNGVDTRKRRAAPRLALDIDENDIARFATVLKGFDEAALDAYVSGLLRRGLSADRFLLELAAPTARLIGEEWEEDRCDFVDVTLATGRLQRLVRSSGARLPAADPVEPASRPSILLASPAGQSHTLGLLMVGEFLHAAGWVVQLGAPFDEAPTLDLVAARHLDVLGLSVSLTDPVAPVREEIRRIRRRSRNRSIAILVGGPAITADPDLVETLGADASCVDARLAPDVALTLL